MNSGVAQTEEARRYSCPVCGIDLAESDFDTPARDYYCPFCSTKQTPQRAFQHAGKHEYGPGGDRSR